MDIWHGLNPAVPLGALLNAGQAAAVAPGLVSDDDREIPAPPRFAIFSAGGMRRRKYTTRILPEQSLIAFERAVRDVLTPNPPEMPQSQLYPVPLEVRLREAATRQTSKIRCSAVNPPETELQSTSTPKRIWNRDHLAPAPCELRIEGMPDSRHAPSSNRTAVASADLVTRENNPEASPALLPITPKKLPKAQQLENLQSQRIPHNTFQVARLIGPRVKVQFGDLKPLLDPASS